MGLVFLAIGIVVAGIVVSLGADVTNSIGTGLTAGSTARLAVDNATSGLGQLARQFPNIGLVAGIAVLISLLLAAFAFGKGGSAGGL